MFWPARTGSGASTLVTETSAEVVIRVATAELLLARFASGVVLETFAVLVMVVPLAVLGLTLTTRVNVCVAPAGSGPPVGGPESCVNDTSVVFAGIVSLTFTFWASLGPLLVVVRV